MSDSNLSVVAALREVAQWQIEQSIALNDNNSIAKSEFPVVDIVAVCLNIHLQERYDGLPSSSVPHKPRCVELLLGDESIPLNKCIKVKCWSSDVVEAALSRKIFQGTVVRLNNVTIRQTSDILLIDMESILKEKTCDKGSLEVICEFHRSWNCTSSKDRLMFILSTGISSMQSEVITSDADTGVSTKFVSDLLKWYNNVFRSSPNFNLHGFYSASLVAYRGRKISEIDAPGLISDIQVKVIRCDEDTANVLYDNNRNAVIPKLPGRSFYAVVSDGQQQLDMMSFHHCFVFKDVIEHAYKHKLYIKISRVLSQQEKAGLVLVPMTETHISIFNGSANEVRNTLFESSTQITQLSPSVYHNSPYKTSSQIIEKQEVLLRIADIFIIDKTASLSSKLFRLLPHELTKVLIDTSNCESYSYERSILTLVHSNKTLLDPLKVSAGPEILMKLCGDIEPTLLVRSDVIYKELVANLVIGLIEEKVELKWYLEKTGCDERWRVYDVKLEVI